MRANGMRLGIYQLDAELGRGGMGTVYRAVAEADGPGGPAGTVVAVKVFHAHLAQKERVFERFRREADIGRRIAHPHIVRTYDVGLQEVDGEPHHYMVMEYVEGQTLAGLLEELGTIPEHLRFHIADQVLDALEAIHAEGIVHRDVKPENVVITPDDRVLLMDLGIARILEEGHTLTEAGEFVGSISFAAPEQFTAGEECIGPAADLYAFGIVLYCLSTGGNPFTGGLPTIIQQKFRGDLTPPRIVHADVDQFWNAVIVTATQKEVGERFASAAEMRRVLREGEAGEWWRRHAADVSSPAAERALKRLQLARDAPLVGRAQVLGTLHTTWRRARKEGGCLLLAGGSGVGKSRLLYDFLEQLVAEGGAAVAAGRCLGTEARQYEPFLQALGDLLVRVEAAPAERRKALEERLGRLLADTPGVVGPLTSLLLGDQQATEEGALSRDALQSTLTRLVLRLADERPLVLAVEDLHLSSGGSVELYRQLMQAAPGRPLLLVGVYTVEEVVEGGPLHELTARPAGEGRTSVLLEPLDIGATEELIRALVGVEHTVRSLSHPLHDRSEGNAFLVLEMLAQLKADGVLVEQEDGGCRLDRSLASIQFPSTVLDVVGLKLSRLDEDQRETLEAAAVIGYEFDASLLAAVLEVKRIHLLKRLAVLERKHRLVVSAGKSGFRFAGHHVFQGLYDGILPELREEYHGLVADTIEERLDGEAPDGRSAFALLRHLLLAGRAAEAEPYLEAALVYLGASFHASYAVPFLERVADAFADSVPEKQIAIAMRQWECYDLQADRAAQMRVLDRAHDLASEIGDAARQAHVHTLRAGSYWYAGDYDKAVEEARTGLALARTAGSRTWEAGCHHNLGAVAFRRGDLETCAREWKEALAIRREIEDRRGQASTLQALALVMPAIGEDDTVLPTMEEALAIWREIGERRGEAAALMNIGKWLVDQGRPEEGLLHLEQAIAKHRETGALVSEAMGLANLGRAHDVLGRLDLARDAWERALALFVHLEDPNGELLVRTMLGGALVTDGAFGDARRHLETAIRLAEAKGAKAKLVSARCEMARLLSAIGKDAEGREQLERALAEARESGNTSLQVTALSMLGHVALACDDAEGALPHLEKALPGARGATAGTATVVLTRYARALQALGRLEEAQTHAREALTRLDEAGAVPPSHGLEVYEALAQILRDDDRHEELRERARSMAEAQARRAGSDATRPSF